MSTLTIISLIFLLLFVASIIIGYTICYFVVGPIILKKHGKRNLNENFAYFGNIMNIEHDLKELAHQGIIPAQKTIKAIKTCKWSLVLNLLLFIGITMLRAFVEN